MPPVAGPPPLVLVHGLWDTPALFNSLGRALGERRELFIPHLPHGLGVVPLEELAAELGRGIEVRFGEEQPLDVMGFSMGGVISRAWIQLRGGGRRVRRFTSVASPQQGTWTAQPWPGRWLASVGDMKVGSPLLQRLSDTAGVLKGIDCCSLYCLADLMVLPGWTAVLPVGRREVLRPLTLQHHELMAHPRSVEQVARELLRP
ncbi:MAG: alpha/beta hydrolase [Cyanobacteria bacterium K_Offshore_surface_m2_239]|nr:alpha/beta hydrolase [Cyanobacteria bacterium K_Offshore_surface_m2_239]